MSHPREAWYALGGSVGLEPGMARPVSLFGEDLALWRAQGGEARVWRNRCRHRGMRLSHGFVRGEQLVCAYHGWRYALDGSCAFIPAHPDTPPPAQLTIPAVESRERHGLIWASLAEQPGQPPDLSQLEPLIFCRSLFVAAAPAVIEARLAGNGPAPGLLTHEADERLLLALQPESGETAWLHLLIAGPADDGTRLKVAKWAAALRARLEAAP